MMITELLTALDAGDHELYPAANDADVKQTETAIGRPLPPSYRAFLTQFSNGAYLYSIQEVSAVGEGNPQIAAIQNIVLAGRPEPNVAVPFRAGGGSAQTGGCGRT